MGCGQGPSQAGCNSAQTYCANGSQLAKDNINVIFPSVTQQISIIYDTSWNKVRQILEDIMNLGYGGTRNPAQTNIDNIPVPTQNNIILLQLYNNIISALQTGMNDINSSIGVKINPNSIISAELLNNIQNYLNNYKLNIDRCAGCNTACNITCNTCQPCDSCQYECWQGCSEGCSQGCIDSGCITSLGPCSQGCSQSCLGCAQY